jgi:6-phosphogluconolactonase
MARPPEIRIANTAADLFQSAAGEFTKMAEQSIRARGKFSVALSGGSTPRDLFSLLASGAAAALPSNSSAGNALPWEKIFFFWSDERHVPPDHPDSNYRMAFQAMLSKVAVPKEHIFRIHGEEKDADTAARAYEQTLRTAFATQPGEIPRFDLILLGIGTEGHTASLFPGSPALQETKRLVVANWVEKLKAERITFTYPLLNNAACIMFLVSGAGKAEILKQILEDPGDLPAQRVQPVDGRLLWMTDRDAAAMLSR